MIVQKNSKTYLCNIIVINMCFLNSYNKKVLSLLFFCSLSLHSFAVTDSLYSAKDSTILLNDISVTAIKQGLNLQGLAIPSTIIGQKNIEQFNLQSVKSVSEIAPNFYVPDYGSRITSSIYVRGLGTRIDQPIIGLNIDNVPIMDKNNYDFDIADIERIEMLRGPQSTLFGRNTMGGLINIYTISPLSFQGTRFMAEYSSGVTFKASISHYTKIKPNFGVGISGYYTSSNGFFTNEYNGEKCDHEKQGSGRIKLQWRPSAALSIDNVFFFSILRQGGYPYESLASGKIRYNDTCFYRRTTFNDGLTINWRNDKFTLSSITSYQYINDNMTLDQDFLPIPYFTLTQARKQHTITQDLVIKGEINKKYKWLVGAFGFYKHLDMDAPVTFKDYGIESLIEKHRNDANPDYPIKWDERQFVLSSNFSTPNYGLAAYHQSTYKLENWTFNAGVRFDFEEAKLNYKSYSNTSYTTYKAIDNTVFSTTKVDINDGGNLNKSFFQILPKISASYTLPMPSPSNIFISISKGYKAGGFNTQMFSDVLQQKIMGLMGLSMSYDVNKIVSYKPEKSWNFEVGSHIECFDRKIQTDISLFYIDCTDQQLTVFPAGSTTGRIMTNAGQTRSFGGELAIKARPISNLEVNASYGYTNAKFIEYNDGRSDYKGNFVPYAPQNTLFGSVSYRLPIRTDWLHSITFSGNAKAVGKIFWDEANTVSQNFYATLGASIRFESNRYSLDLWGQNLSDTNFHSFYFVSIGNAFLQRGKPRLLGVTLRVKI